MLPQRSVPSWPDCPNQTNQFMHGRVVSDAADPLFPLMFKCRLVLEGAKNRDVEPFAQECDGGIPLQVIVNRRTASGRLIQYDPENWNPALAQRFDREQGMIDAAERRTADDQRGQAKREDKIPHVEPVSNRHHHASDSLDEQKFMPGRKSLEGIHDTVHLNRHAGSPGSSKRRQGDGEPIGADEVDRIMIVGAGLQARNIGQGGAARLIAGFNGLHHADRDALLSETACKSSRHHGLSDTGIGPCDKAPAVSFSFEF